NRPRPVELPAAFVEHNREDPIWLHRLPELIDYFAALWDLRLSPPFSGIEISYVAPARHTNGTQCVFKVSRHIGDTATEIAALELWDGNGAARLLRADAERGALLIERLEPGTTLVEVSEENDDSATLIAADVLRQLWRPAPQNHALRTLESWFDGYDRN